MKKRVSNLLKLFLIILMMGLLIFATAQGGEANRYHEDLSALLVPDGLKFFVDGEEVPRGATVQVRDGMLYDLTIPLKEAGADQFSNDEQMYFQLPEGFVLPEDFAENMTINLGLDGKVYGNKLTYDADHNRLLLDWNKEDRKFNRLTAAGNLKLNLHVSGYIQPGEVKYAGESLFTAERYDPHNATVSKTGLLDASDMEYQTITYTVVVLSDGSTENLLLTDVMGSALSYVTDENGIPKVTWARSTRMSSQAEARRVKTTPIGTEASAEAPSIRNTAEGFAVTIPETHDGDVLTFTYTAKVDYTKIAMSGNASFDEMGNTVQIFGDSDPIDNISVFHQKEVAYSDLVKEVSGPSRRYTEEGHEYQKLTWSIDTNSYMMISFRDTDITDHITVYSDSPDNPQVIDRPTAYTGDGITIQVYEWNEEKTERVLRETRQIPWEELDVAADMDATKGWTYHVPESDGIYEYRITYETRTDVTKLAANADVHNTATSKGGTDEVSKLLHPKGNGLGVGKRVVNQTEEEVTWEITVTLNDIAAGWNQPLIVEDLLPVGYVPNEKGVYVRYKDSYIRGSLTVQGLQQGEDYKEYVSEPANWADDKDTADREKHRYTGLTKDTDFVSNERNRNVLMITFYQGENKAGLQPPEDGGDSRVLTIRFKSKINQTWVKAAWEKYGKQAIWNGLRHTNDVYANTQHEYAQVITPGRYLTKDFVEAPTTWGYNLRRFETYISGKQPGSTIVIDDYFDGTLWRLSDPAQVQFRAGVVTHYAKSVSTPEHQDYWVQGEYGSSVEVLEEGHVRFTIGELPLKSDGTAWPFYGVNYYLTPKDEEAWQAIQQLALEQGGIATFVNRAESEDMEDSDYYTAELQPEFKPILKSDPMPQNQAETVEYTLLLNQRKRRLNEGQPITVEDEFGKEGYEHNNLSIDYTTIRIETDPAGRDGEISYDFSGYVGTFTIPDETLVKITYRAKVLNVTGKEGEQVEATVYNVASMLGWHDGGERTIKVEKGGDASIYRIRLFKYGSGHMEKGLNGAVFGLYEKNADGTYSPICYNTDNNKNPIQFTTRDVKLLNGLILTEAEYNKLLPEEKAQVVERSGYALVELHQQEDGVYLSADKDYYLKEEGVPKGYNKDATVEYYSFRFGAEPDYEGGAWLYYNNDILKARNSPEDGAFSFLKRIEGNYELSEEELAALRFTVQKKTVEGSWEDIGPALTFADVKEGYTVTNIGPGVFRIVESMAEGKAIPGSVTQRVSFTRDGIEEDLTELDGESFVCFTITQEDIDRGLEHTFEITNNYHRETVNLHAKKAWLDAENNAITPEGAEVVFGVFPLTDDAPSETPVMTVRLDGKPDEGAKDHGNVTGESTAWVAQFAGLPVKDDAGETITYVVKEITGLAGYEVSYGEENASWLVLSAESTPVITNKQETVAFEVKKQWAPAPPAGAEVTIGIYYGQTEAEARDKAARGAKPYREAKVSMENGWTAKFDSLPKGDGTGSEYQWIAVETASYGAFQPQYGENLTYLPLDQNTASVIQNVLAPAQVVVSGQKILNGRNMAAKEFTFRMYPIDVNGNKIGQEVTTTHGAGEAGQAVDFTFAPLQLEYQNATYHDAQGNALYYYIVEEQIPEEQDGIEYDLTKYLVVVKISYLDGELQVEQKKYKYEDGIPTEERPKPAPASIKV